MADEVNNEALSKINQRFLPDDTADKLPEVTLPDGTKIQTGTVGALLQHIKLYDRMCAGEQVAGAPSREELEHFMTVPLATLKKVGMFDIFNPEEWMAGDSVGRRFCGRKAKEMGY